MRGLAKRRSRGLSETWRSEDSWYCYKHHRLDANSIARSVSNAGAEFARSLSAPELFERLKPVNTLLVAASHKKKRIRYRSSKSPMLDTK
jgi:hypothetical protein